MNLADQHRVTKRHLERSAVVYVRQSDPSQVRENTESTALQRGLREKAMELGWPAPKLVEDDLGITASGFAERPGFQWMLAQVTLRKVGIIFCIEASRLSRNSPDWAQLFELCGHFDTLIADVQQVYDVAIPNDRLVLQIKGTVAELELSSLRTRMRAGIESKAARGALRVLLPPGYVYENEEIGLDPDERVRQAIRSMFESFEHQTSVRQLALTYRDTQTLFPVRKPRKRGELSWELPKPAVLHKLLSHPVYAGVYTYGRTRSFVDYAEGRLVKRTKRVGPPEQWKVCIRDHHEAYVSWERYQRNQAKLAEARPRWTMDDNRGAVRQGRALLAGLVRCGHCGRKLRVTYNRASSATYYCDGSGPRRSIRCLVFGAKYVDREVGKQLCEAMTPVALGAAERAFELEHKERKQEVEQAQLRVQAAQYAADRAFEQYDLADPKNRLVVDNLEQRLNEKLGELRVARENLELKLEGQPGLTEQQRREVHRLSRNFPLVWNHPETPTELRKQLLRAAIVEVVVRHDGGKLAFSIHWAGNVCTSLTVQKRVTPVGSKADASLTELVEKLARTLDDGEIARILNMKKLPTPRGLRWTNDRVRAFRAHHRIQQRKPASDSDILTGLQAREHLGVGYNGLMALVRRGAVHTNQVTDFAPYQISRAELDSEPVQSLVRALKSTGRLPPEGGCPQRQQTLFSTKSTKL